MIATVVECTVGDPWCPIHGWGYCSCNSWLNYPSVQPIGAPPAELQPWPGPIYTYEEIESRKQMLALASAMSALIEAGVKVNEIEIVIGTDHSTIVRKRPSSQSEPKEDP